IQNRMIRPGLMAQEFEIVAEIAWDVAMARRIVLARNFEADRPILPAPADQPETAFLDPPHRSDQVWPGLGRHTMHPLSLERLFDQRGDGLRGQALALKARNQRVPNFHAPIPGCALVTDDSNGVVSCEHVVGSPP